jgi:hypothetical protein
MSRCDSDTDLLARAGRGCRACLTAAFVAMDEMLLALDEWEPYF